MSGRRIEELTGLSEQAAAAVLALVEAAAAEDGQPAVSEQGRLHVRRGTRAGVRHLLVWGAADAAGGPAGSAGSAGSAGMASGAGAGTASGAGTALGAGTASGAGTAPGAGAAPSAAASGGGEHLIGYGQIDGSDPVEAPAGELVVHPAYRSRGHGRALGEAMLAATGKRLRVWAHGGHPAARHLAAQLGLKLFRELRQMRRPLDPELSGLPEPRLPDGVSVRTFEPGRDESAWLAVNAAAFAHHPEQGSLTLQDLQDREHEPWFDPAGFFLAFRGAALAGFHWTKVHAAEGLGEVYVVGVSPSEQSGGLGRALTTIGLRHLAADRGLRTAMLYVDADNAPAVAVYERLGFVVHETDVMFRTES